jgi:hypothetical protein
MKLFVTNNHENEPFGKIFQFRWKEPLGLKDTPYLYRWTLILFGHTICLHHWIRSDDNRYFHDHSCDLVSIILKGWYYNITPADDDCLDVKYRIRTKVTAWEPRFMSAEKKHYLLIPPEGAWTLLFQGKPYMAWGFWVNNHKWRPLRYFHKFGIIQDASYTGEHDMDRKIRELKERNMVVCQKTVQELKMEIENEA